MAGPLDLAIVPPDPVPHLAADVPGGVVPDQRQDPDALGRELLGGRREDGGPLAVIDIGSNSGRVVVYRVGPEGGFRIQATTRAALLEAARRPRRGRRKSAG